MKILIIDNYDSFTFNLYQLVGTLLTQNKPLQPGDAHTVDVIRNNECALEEIRTRGYERIIISPGPGHPAQEAYFGVCSQVITQLGPDIPLLGVCLGMQGIAQWFGGGLLRLNEPIHGKTSTISHDDKGIFKGIAQHTEVMRYHSWVVNPQTLPAECIVSARVDDASGAIMAIRHTRYPIEGVQFHPESFASEDGRQLVKNFLAIP